MEGWAARASMKASGSEGRWKPGSASVEGKPSGSDGSEREKKLQALEEGSDTLEAWDRHARPSDHP